MIHDVSQTVLFFFFFNDTATTEIYTLSLHDALPISTELTFRMPPRRFAIICGRMWRVSEVDRKSTRLNSSHSQISYAVFCLKKKKHDFYHRFSLLVDIRIEAGDLLTRQYRFR